MTDIVERLRFDAARCEVGYSKGVAGNIEEAAAEIERLRAPWEPVDEKDWIDAAALLGNGGRGQFWQGVLRKMRAALEQSATTKDG